MEEEKEGKGGCGGGGGDRRIRWEVNRAAGEGRGGEVRGL